MLYALVTGVLASELAGRADMRHIVQPELLDIMKDRLRDLENIQLLSPDDLDIIDQKRSLRQQIADLEMPRV
jgi:hypothetical protein